MSISKPEIFLCHSSKDKHYVRRLAMDLELLGVVPWFDAWELSVGESLVKRIGQGISSASYFGLILSTNSEKSNWCNNELEEALNLSIESGENRVLLVKKGKVSIPPFVRGKLYIDAPRYSLNIAVRLACKVYGISPRLTDLFLEANRRPTHSEACSFIAESMKDKSISFGATDWKRLQDLFGERNVRISDAIRIHDLRTGSKIDLC